MPLVCEMTTSDRPSSPIIPIGMLPNYLADAFGDLYEEDGLAVIAKGLQWEFLLAAFCRFYADVDEGHLAVLEEEDPKQNDATNLQDTASSKDSNKKPPLVLVLGLKDEVERSMLVEILQSWGTPTSLLPTMITNESGQAKERMNLYAQGGILVITSRILIVDLLAGTIQASEIDGILIAHADQVTEQSTEAFIIRIFQSQRKEPGFIKAFSDAPDALISGFAKVDKVLKALHVRRLYLYPRFHSDIRDELEQENAIQVTEYHQELSKRQKEIQNAIAVLVLQCLRQLKQATEHLVSWSSVTNSDLSVENCVTQQFDRAVSRQLEPYWHQLPASTKQLVQDLRTLRTLFHALLQYDCVSFWKLLNSIRTMSAASRHPSLWLLEAAADTLFRKAKERVYIIERPLPTPKIPNPVAQLVSVLEENPKWKLLKSVLQEIKEEEKERDCMSRWGPSNILVMVKDDKTLETLRFYLTEENDGTKTKSLQKRWLRYLEQSNDRSRSITDSRGDTSSISEESRLLLEEEGRCRRLLKDSYQKAQLFKSKNRKMLNEIPAYVRKRRRIAVEKGRGDLTGDDLERQAVLDDAVEEAKHDLDVEAYDGSGYRTSGQRKNKRDEQDMYRVSVPDRDLQVVLKSYSDVEGGRAHLLLQDIRPDFVVLYDVEVEFIRAVEIYSALLEGRNYPVRVFFLIFEASAEEKSFKKVLEREQSAFERLVHHKKTMPPPSLRTLESQELQLATGSESSYMGGSLPLAVDTRRGKGKLNTSNQRRDIAVDVREFRSVLPSILHQGGMRLAPVTLVVGDFVLSNVHCVERKSISDLFGSFSSGRLYSQAEAMSKYYKCPCLLIEFDPAKSFCLQNTNELGVEIRSDSVCSKMALLTMHFPKLRILWSRSPHETLKIFRELKLNHEEVDVERAVEIGKSESEEFLLQPDNKDGEEDEINETARDMLLRLPGVNVHSARKIMQNCDSLAELSEMSRDDLRRIAGPITGQKLFTFFRQKLAST